MSHANRSVSEHFTGHERASIREQLKRRHNCKTKVLQFVMFVDPKVTDDKDSGAGRGGDGRGPGVRGKTLLMVFDESEEQLERSGVVGS